MGGRLMTDVDLPVVGNARKEWVYAGGALVVGIVGYAWIRRSRVPVAAPLDPAADIGAAGYAGTPGASSSAPVTVDNRDTTAIDTNAKWTQYAVEKLTGYGWEPALVTEALGRYLDRQPLDDKQVSAVQSARGVAGDAPVGGPYQIIRAQPTPQPDAPAKTRQVAVKGGQRVSDYGDMDVLQRLNPGLNWPRIGDANNNGFYSPTNVYGPFWKVFLSDQFINVPA